jgi:LacI family transcriptional regulator
MARRNASQQDVAERSQVSRSTVAAILRNDPKFSFTDETRRRVQEAARELGYHGHSGARALRGGRTHTLALAIPQFSAISGAIQSQNLRGIGDAAQELGYSLTICSYGTVRQMKPAFERLMRESRFDGVILHGDERADDDPRERIIEEFGLPCVVLERHSGRAAAWVDFDHQLGAAKATRHLIAAGRKRIALVGDRLPLRRRGYADALEEAGRAVNARLVQQQLPGEPYEQVARKAVDQWFGDAREHPDALFCLTDEIAAAAIAALTERGIRVPDDVAVVGYDDSKLAAYANPSLTSVRQDGVLMGREAVRLLIRCIEHPDERVEPVVIRPTLTVRNSCGTRKQGSGVRHQESEEIGG